MSNSKSATSVLFNRYIWLANTIYNAGAITYDDICTKWRNSGANSNKCEMTLRTFHNHRKAILELFDIDIQCDKHNGWKYYIENDEIIGDDSLRRWMLSTLAVNNLIRESKDLKDKILLEEIPSGLKYLTQIIEALRECNVIEIEHISFWRDAEYSIMLEPYCIKLFRQRWYVVGRNQELDSIRVYALDRFKNCNTLNKHFLIPPDFNGAHFFSEYFGVYLDDNIKLETIRIKADKISMNYLRSLPLHSSQKEVITESEYAVFEYTIRPTKDFVNEIVSMSEFIKIISPKWIADEVKEKLKRIIKRQNGD